MQQIRASTAEYARTLLRWLFYYAKFLGVINCRLDRDQLRLHRVARSGKCVMHTVRLLLIITFTGALDNLFRQYKLSDVANTGSYIGVFAIFQIVSVSIFAVFVFIVQTRCEVEILQMLNEYMRLYRRILERCRYTTVEFIDTMMGSGILNRKFLAIFMLKTATTMIGYVNELPALLQVEDLFNNGLINFVAAFVGVYLWIGSMFLLDVCVLGLLIIALMYDEMGKFLKRMLSRLYTMEETVMVEVEMDMEMAMMMETSNRKKEKLNFTKYERMKLLCDCADAISDCDIIYAELYALTKQFQYLFQWQILYYIYYNFMVILLLFHNCIWMYLKSNDIDKLGLLMLIVKVVNLAVLIMCADFTLSRWQMPQLLPVDVVCSDIDDRWDTSVETFLSRRQVEDLEIKILGFFRLNNEFILLIMSAIVSYLFIIIQFGLKDIK